MASTALAPFNRDGDFVVLKKMFAGGRELPPGEPFPKEIVNTRRLRQLYEDRKIGRPSGFVRQKPVSRREGYDYGSILVNAEQNRADRLAREKSGTSVAAQAAGEAIDLRPREVPVEQEPAPVQSAPVEEPDAAPVREAVTVTPDPSLLSATTEYSPEDMGLAPLSKEDTVHAAASKSREEALARKRAGKKRKTKAKR